MSRGLPLAVAVAVLAAPACRAPEDAFTQRVASRARERLGDAKVAVKGRFHLELVGGDGTRQQMFLDNLWLQCQARDEGCEAAIDRSLGLLAQGQASNDAFAKPAFVRAILKDREWMENVRRMMEEGPPDKAAENAVVGRPFVADLFIVYAFDLPDGMKMMSRADMAALKLGEEELHALALANLEREIAEIGGEAIEPGSRIRVLHVGDSYEASRVLLHGRWKRIAEGVEGDLIVAAPSRDYVYYTGSREDLPGLRALARRAAAENDHGVSATLLRWKSDGWEALP